ncbi:hypothetical protein HHK36_025436 [Tetracentron sinense]|uniref:Protein BIG GRAIN 1-like B n=1 Tax=Tetracentron sinense TaxID=13715 RepID=A0A835D3J9_TETSI|nr:hypothetical protein HHK36_025436 [Tetracentron sinense]
MDNKWGKSLREDRFQHGRKNPSFSSTLLDKIYRSIDEGEGEAELVLYRETMRKKQSSFGANKEEEDEMGGVRRACMIEKWMEKKVSEKVVVRKKSVPDFDRKVQNYGNSMLLNSTSSSSESSCGGFSSSETDSVNGFSAQRPKPIRTSAWVRSEKPLHHEHHRNYVPQQIPKHEDGFIKTKSKALKFYEDLKKTKQPISPGGRLTSFLNSLFTTGNAKKAKISSSSIVSCDNTNTERNSKSKSKSKSTSTQASTCSSASTFSRSCLSKTSSSRGNLSNGTKRTVRFCPVSVIVDEYSRPCGHKCLYEEQPSLMAVKTVRKISESPSLNEELKFHLMERNRRVEESARDLLKSYQKKRDLHDDDDDAASYSSSDLFELDNLAAIGIERYREELPVYETTHLDTNRAIANGLIL